MVLLLLAKFNIVPAFVIGSRRIVPERLPPNSPSTCWRPSMDHRLDLAVGNVVGSNIGNILLILVFVP